MFSLSALTGFIHLTRTDPCSWGCYSKNGFANKMQIRL